jgi:hypothetical protein
MERLTLPEIKTEIDRLAAIIQAPANLLPGYGQTRDFGYPHIEVDSRGYHYIVTERGNELQHLITAQLDDLLYQVFEDVTSSMGSVYAVNHRAPKHDFRRSMFQRQIDLLTQLSLQWAQRCALNQGRILANHPFVDR